jgi:hypothetical protein
MKMQFFAIKCFELFRFVTCPPVRNPDLMLLVLTLQESLRAKACKEKRPTEIADGSFAHFQMLMGGAVSEGDEFGFALEHSPVLMNRM